MAMGFMCLDKAARLAGALRKDDYRAGRVWKKTLPPAILPPTLAGLALQHGRRGEGTAWPTAEAAIPSS
jgi:hypothetical protein